jgi:hypothetical protein
MPNETPMLPAVLPRVGPWQPLLLRQMGSFGLAIAWARFAVLTFMMATVS